MSNSKSDWIIDVGDADFQKLVLDQSHQKPVVVDFWAEWCGPCRMLGPILEKLVAERKGEVILAKVNTEESQNLAVQYRIEAIPAVKAFRDGKVVLEFEGVLPEPHLRNFLDQIMPTAADRIVQEAVRAEVDLPAKAEELYRQALSQDFNHEAAIVGLARVLVGRNGEAEAAELLLRVGSRGEHGAEAERLNAIIFLRQRAAEFGSEADARKRLQANPNLAERHFELGCVVAAAGRYQEAMDLLLVAAEKDRKLAGDKVKEVMVKIFHIIGLRSAMADEYRDKLTSVLY